MASGNSHLPSKSGFPMATICIILDVQKKPRRPRTASDASDFYFIREKLFSLDLPPYLRLDVVG